jgi:hypothetical protein
LIKAARTTGPPTPSDEERDRPESMRLIGWIFARAEDIGRTHTHLCSTGNPFF